ncbi:MAG: efflux RND transporter permease subunit, partial [Spirochaetales bacterium]|nr:efflux RND transporter permease subunit [Spirochaetales bacterium]
MKLTEYSVNHKVTTIMIFVALTTFGVISLSRLGLELFPDITYPTVAVVTIDTGVSPYEVETNISKPIEDAVSSINGVENVSSTSSEGISFVTVNFIWGTNMSTIVPEIREKLTDVEADLPDDAERPMIFRYNPEVLPSITFVVESDIEGLDLRRLAEKRIVPEIEKVKGVAAADIYGGKKQAVTCKLNVEDLSKLNISITQVLKAFQGENINIPAGSININNKYLVIRTIGKFSQLKDIGNVLIGYRGKIPVLLKDISSIELGDLPQEEFVLSSARNTIEIQIRKQPGHNTVDVIEQVKNTVNSIKKSLPPSVRIRIQSDQSKSIIMSIGGVASAAWQGGLLAILVLLFFLRNVSSTLIISVAIPVSIVTTFSLMDFGHITMNIMSLAGITLGIGMLVDNSIVVLESIYRKQLS